MRESTPSSPASSSDVGAGNQAWISTGDAQPATCTASHALGQVLTGRMVSQDSMGRDVSPSNTFMFQSPLPSGGRNSGDSRDDTSSTNRTSDRPDRPLSPSLEALVETLTERLLQGSVLQAAVTAAKAAEEASLRAVAAVEEIRTLKDTILQALPRSGWLSDSSDADSNAHSRLASYDSQGAGGASRSFPASADSAGAAPRSLRAAPASGVAQTMPQLTLAYTQGGQHLLLRPSFSSPIRHQGTAPTVIGAPMLRHHLPVVPAPAVQAAPDETAVDRAIAAVGLRNIEQEHLNEVLQAAATRRPEEASAAQPTNGTESSRLEVVLEETESAQRDDSSDLRLSLHVPNRTAPRLLIPGSLDEMSPENSPQRGSGASSLFTPGTPNRSESGSGALPNAIVREPASSGTPVSLEQAIILAAARRGTSSSSEFHSTPGSNTPSPAPAAAPGQSSPSRAVGGESHSRQAHLPASRRPRPKPKLGGLRVQLGKMGKMIASTAGVIPWGPSTRSKAYQIVVLFTSVAVFAGVLEEACRVGRDELVDDVYQLARLATPGLTYRGHVIRTIFAPLSVVLCAAGAVVALLCNTCLDGSKDFLGVVQALDEYATQQGYDDLQLMIAGADMLVFLGAFLAVVVLQWFSLPAYLPNGVKVGELCAAAIVFFIVMAHTLFLVSLCRKLQCMVENFCLRVIEHAEFLGAVKEWNVQHALLKKACHAAENCILVHLALVVVYILLFVVEGVQAGFQVSTFPRIVLVLWLSQIILKGASVTDHCMKVPTLINSINVDGEHVWDEERMYAVHFIASSRAGFSIANVNVSTKLLVTLAVIFGLAITDFFLRSGS